MSNKSVSVFLIVVICFFVSMSLGATPWTTAGSTGTIDEAYLNVYKTNLSYIYFRPAVTGYIVVRYNVTNPFDFNPIHMNWNRLYVTFRDQGNTSRIRAYLRRVQFSNGLINTITMFDSDLFPALNAVQLGFRDFTHQFNFARYAYFIDVYIYRSTDNVNPAVYALKLDYYLY